MSFRFQGEFISEMRPHGWENFVSCRLIKQLPFSSTATENRVDRGENIRNEGASTNEHRFRNTVLTCQRIQLKIAAFVSKSFWKISVSCFVAFLKTYLNLSHSVCLCFRPFFNPRKSMSLLDLGEILLGRLIAFVYVHSLQNVLLLI